jgi:hypothetical protein
MSALPSEIEPFRAERERMERVHSELFQRTAHEPGEEHADARIEPIWVFLAMCGFSALIGIVLFAASILADPTAVIIR